MGQEFAKEVRTRHNKSFGPEDQRALGSLAADAATGYDSLRDASVITNATTVGYQKPSAEIVVSEATAALDGAIQGMNGILEERHANKASKKKAFVPLERTELNTTT
jgi:hypothetical protein